MKQRFFKCSHCGNIIAMVEDKGVPVMCCGEKMQEIIPNSTDGARETHIPSVAQDGNLVIVNVGLDEHPMSVEHSIQWISIETEEGNQRKTLAPGRAAWAEFSLVEDDELIAVYAYCNRHGLWKKEIKK
ncbi:MAG: desulfoferrodoxin [Firmicutes bacterium]|nr:desulfoferrodoxin [Bacillota bacterium]